MCIQISFYKKIFIINKLFECTLLIKLFTPGRQTDIVQEAYIELNPNLNYL